MTNNKLNVLILSNISLIKEIEDLLPETEKEAFKNSLKEGAPTLEQQEEDSKNFLDRQKEQEELNDIKPLNTDFRMI